MPVKIDDVKPGDRLVCDDGFTCMDKGAIKIVEKDDHGLWIPCSSGMHFLDGQVDSEDGILIGLERAP